jgi:alpha-mannosidase
MTDYLRDFLPVWRIVGKYSGNLRDLKAEFEAYMEPDSDDPEAWLKEERFEDSFKDYVKNVFTQLNITSIDITKRDYYICGQSHIDVAWLWRYMQTCRKAIVTFRKAVWHARNHPSYVFAASEPVLLEWIRQVDPRLFEDIKVTVKDNRFDLVGGMYVEPDCHLPSGEAFCRSRLYGQRFYLEHFGKLSEVEWVPDSFGYANTLPQIFLKSGSKYFHTTKLCGNSYSQFPFVNFLWESPDGSQVLACLSPGGFGSMSRRDRFDPVRRPLKPGKKLRADYSTDQPEAENVYANEIPPIGIWVGKGDGGHGPTGEEVAVLDLLVEHGLANWMSVTDYFTTKLEKFRDRLPVWADELYYEYHRGTLTTHGLVKRMNRYFEWRLVAVEKFVAAVAALKGIDVKAWSDMLTTAWKFLMLNQFHDVLPGSSIPEVYDDVYDIWEYQKNLVDAVEKEAWQALLGENDASGSPAVLLFNAAGYDVVDAMIEVPFDGADTPASAITGSGEPVAVQLVEADNNGLDELFVSRPRRLLFKTSVPQHAFALVSLSSDATPAQVLATRAEDGYEDVVLENELYRVTIVKATGNITSIFYKVVNEELLVAPGAELAMFFDWHTSEQAWNIAPAYRTMRLDDQPAPTRVSVTETGPVRFTAEIERKMFNEGSESPENGTSKVIQRVSIVDGAPGIFIEFVLDWHTCEATTKLDFYLASMGERLVSETPYGTISRLANPTANHDVPRWENVHHTWVDVPAGDDKSWGIAFINNGKYGHDTKGNRIGLTLVRGPFYPNPSGESWTRMERANRARNVGGAPPLHADLGAHLIRYIMLPHEGTWSSSVSFVPAMAHWFNEGCVQAPVPASFEADFLGNRLAWVEGANAEIGSIKLGEDGTGRVLRVVESAGTGGTVTVKLHAAMNVTGVQEIDILERPLESQDGFEVAKNDVGPVSSITFMAKPHDIRTFLVNL